MPTANLVAGVHCSARQLTILVCDADSGASVREGRAAYPEGGTAGPRTWLRAFGEAAAGGLLEGVGAVGVAARGGQALGLDANGAVVAGPLPDGDPGASGAAAELVDELGGPAAWTAATGAVPGAMSAVAQLRRLARFEPGPAERISTVLLPHDWVTWKLLGCPPEPVTDRADASTTGYFATLDGPGRWDGGLLAMALGRPVRTPRVLGPGEAAGVTPEGVLVSAGTGASAALALGAGLAEGEVVVALGSAGAAFTPCPRPPVDPAGSGTVAAYADAAGGFLPTVRTVNAARVLRGTAAMLGVAPDSFDALATASTPGAHGLVLLPYLDGERVPDLPGAAGTLAGLRHESMTPQALARAAVEGMLCVAADALDALRASGIRVDRVLLAGAAARSAAVRAAAPMLLGVPVATPPPAAVADFVARGAALQAAWALTGAPPGWSAGVGPFTEPGDDLAVGEAVRAQYLEVRNRLHPPSPGEPRPAGGPGPGADGTPLPEPRAPLEPGGRHRRSP